MDTMHSTHLNGEGKSPPPEHHEFKCRALTIPIEIVYLVHDRTINVKLAYLLAIIDGLVQCRGDGCFASNGWLADRIQVKERQLRNLLEKAIELGLVIVLWTERGRVLETKWSRIAESDGRGSAKNCQSFGKKLPKPPAKNCLYRNMGSNEGEEGEGGNGRKAVSNPPPNGKPSSNGHVQSSAKKVKPAGFSESQKIQPDEECHGFARQLRKALRTNQRQVRDGSEAVWADYFRLIRDTDHQNIPPVLDWYCQHCNKEDEERLGLPSIASAKEFRKCFSWIERKKRKAEKESGESQGVQYVKNADGSVTGRSLSATQAGE